MREKYAYVTLATNEQYLNMAAYLQASLRMVKSKYPLIIMITEDLKNNKLLSYFDDNIIIPYTQFFTKSKVDRYKNTINKFYAFNLVQYNKLIFVDADVFLFVNIDSFFHLNSKFICSTYSRFVLEKNKIFPLNCLMVITPDKIIYKTILDNMMSNSLLTDDESVIYYLLYPHQFQNDNSWDEECNTFENLGIEFDINFPIYIHAKKWQFFFHNINITPQLLEKNNYTNIELIEYIIMFYQQDILKNTGILLSKLLLKEHFISRGQLKYFNNGE